MNDLRTVPTHAKLKRMRRRGFGLPFVLLVLMVITTLVAAAVVRYAQTVQYSRLGGELVTARMIADSGLEMAVTLMRDQDHDWFASYSQPISNIDLGLSDDVLGGSFELDFHTLPSVSMAPGSFVTVRCVGRVGRKESTSLATVKVTSLISNYLLLPNGNYTIKGNRANSNVGPILVTANGDEGNLLVWHDRYGHYALTGAPNHEHGDLEFRGSIKATGQFVLTNEIDGGGNTLPPLKFKGRIPAGNYVHNDLPLPSLGSLVLPEDLEVDSDARLRSKVPEVDIMLEKARTQTGALSLDISAYPEGVLAEFVDGRLVISPVERSLVGRVYDKEFHDQNQADLKEVVKKNRGVNNSQAKKILKEEVAWDDPFFSDRPYPPDLVNDIDGDGVVETDGDWAG